MQTEEGFIGIKNTQHKNNRNILVLLGFKIIEEIHLLKLDMIR